MATRTQNSEAQNLTEFFGYQENRNVRTAKRILRRAVDAIAGEANERKDLSADTIFVSGNPAAPRVYLEKAEPDTRPDTYNPPEDVSAAWLRNQYALGVSFYIALAEVLSPGAIHEIVPGLNSTFSRTLLHMTSARYPGDQAEGQKGKISADYIRFKNPQEAIRFVDNIPEASNIPVVKILVGAAMLLLLVASGAFYFFNSHKVGTHKPTELDPIPVPNKSGVPSDMVAISSGASSFFLDRHEVSVRRYNEAAQKQGVTMAFAGQSYATDYPNHPVWNVSWSDAQKFCNALHRRLPTNNEWEAATNSKHDEWTAEGAHVNVDTGELRDVGATKADKTAEGVYDLAGNLPEWLAEDGADGGKVVRGGAYYLPASVIFKRMSMPPALSTDKGYLRIGFRCAMDVPNGK